jgi:orotate phosphoribosyltransferase
VKKDKMEFIAFLVRNEALMFGDFTLKSGDRSPFFIDLGRIRSGRALGELGDRLAVELRAAFPDCSLLFGPAYKGISMAAAVAISCWNRFGTDMGLFYDRKEGKQHGEKGAFVGQLPRADDRIVIIDDVLSSGGTKLAAVEAIHAAFGVKPRGALVCVDRTRRGCALDPSVLNVQAVVNLSDLSAFLMQEGDEGRAETVRRFWEGADGNQDLPSRPGA